MLKTLRRVTWQQWLMIAGLALSLVFIGVFLVRAGRHAPRRNMNDPIRPWMNLPYIAHSYHVAAHILYQALGLPSFPRDRRPILDIARDQNRPVQSLIILLEEAILQARATNIAAPTPTPGPVRSTP